MVLTDSAQGLANIKDKTGGGLQAVEDDKTKKLVSDAVWERARPGMHRASLVCR
jgi:hypothetical protein